MSALSLLRPSLLIVDDDPLILETLSYILSGEYELATATDRTQAIALLRSRATPVDLALIDLGLPPHPHRPDEGLTLIEELIAHDPAMKIIVLSGQNEEAGARHARTVGALDFIAKPAEPGKLKAALARAVALRRGEAEQVLAAPALERLRGSSGALQEARALIRQYAALRFPVLIEGESGSGKEIAALALHELGNKFNAPFIALNCGAISAGLIETTLFGHARGAFTGAMSANMGYFEEATDGTLFLDEIGELPLELQPKLLRVLETGEFQRVGETVRRQSSARIVAATNRNLRLEVQQGRFRADLYHRLSVLRVPMPPLRSMGTDKHELFAHYVKEYAQQTGALPIAMTEDAHTVWQGYEFPGNVRELRNIVVRLLMRYAGQQVTKTQLAAELEYGEAVLQFDAPKAMQPLPTNQTSSQRARQHIQQEEGFSLDVVLREVERDYVMAALDLAHGNISQAARYLGVNRTTLYSRIDNLRLSESSPVQETYSTGKEDK